MKPAKQLYIVYRKKENFYNQHQTNMSFLKKLFRPHAKSPTPTDKPEIKFEDFKEKIYPWIKVTVQDNEPAPPGEFIFKVELMMKPWLGNLVIFYAVDEGHAFSLLQKNQVPPEMSVDELNRLAVENLSRDVEFQFRETNFGGHGFIAGGDHETGSLCLPEIWKWCATELGDDLIVAVPAKDIVMMVRASDEEKIDQLKTFVTELHATGERLLTKQLYRYDAESQQWSIYDTAD